jgi:hypothetical protein
METDAADGTARGAPRQAATQATETEPVLFMLGKLNVL